MNANVLVLVLCSGLLCVSAREGRVLQELLQLSNTCSPLYVNVDKYDEIDIKSSKGRMAQHSVSAGSSCTAYFKTSLPGHGICINMNNMFVLTSHFQMEFQTGPVGAERIIRHEDWRSRCFPHSLVVVRVKTSTNATHIDRSVSYGFSVTNVTLDSIQRQYYMDSFSECGLTHSLTSGQEVSLESERVPHVTTNIPQKCELTFESTSEDEYEQVCVELTVVRPLDSDDGVTGLQEKAGKSLEIEGLNSRFYTKDKALSGEVVCSDQKSLKLTLTRNPDAPFRFTATVSSQWHPYWDTEDSEASELRGLRIVKGITYFIATIDSLVAVLAACLAAMLKRPTGPWRRWAEYFNAHTAAHAPQAYPPQDPATYGSMHSCKDGNYQEMPLEGATPIKEVLVEAHTY